MINDQLLAKGDIEQIKEFKSGKKEKTYFPNRVLLNGRKALAKSLANVIGDEYDFFVTRMLFGDGGTTGSGVKKYVDAGRTGLFGVTKLSKPVLSNIDGVVPTQVIFTSVILFEDAVGVTLNEMALQMSNGELYSMTTFPDLNKTDDMQLTYNWILSFI